MFEASQKSRSLEIILKLSALICGVLLIAASIVSGNTFSSGSSPSQFLQDQLQLLVQLKWFIGLLFIVFGVLYSPQKALIQSMYSGPKDISHDAYKLYLVNKYGIEKNAVLDQLTCGQRLFPSVAEALLFAHELECVNERSVRNQPSVAIHAPVDSQPSISSTDSINTSINDISRISSFSSQIVTPPLEKHHRLIFLLGLPLFTVVLGGLYYANTHSVKEEVVVIVESTPSSNTDQVVTNSIPTNPSPPAEQAAEIAPKSTVTPINELWIGTWNALGNKQKLAITASSFKYGNDDFTWAGVRPKGVIQCCPAFYEGSTSKAELLARIQEPAANTAVKGDQQKTLEMVKALSEGNFKKIVLADPFLRKYFFIYDQNTIYRINRDLGDNAELVLEPFRKQE
ncbi:hypothetical protein [Polynucleobacter sp. AP-Ainpum-60-G11]|uniref:hypothetical protein n=1 Tax=Polynucleobacter sp. AP-Ainpum-60-G11 TaxID=2576926 RepID=UPI001BFE9D33|nr:hypothetical protein [Polynucleobacter sp. AP-Ainpum-60-G11]QWE27193.1 hypothetical protein FD971_02565 [Polynucleobacter sp. AP-Ainpum-60-G11]